MADDVTKSGDVFGKRYGEVLLVNATESGPKATVYNTFPLNDCPAELWDPLDAEAIAAENGAAAALLNGPRHWPAWRTDCHRPRAGGYEARTPASAVRVDTTAVEPCVIQDDLANS